MERVPQRGNEGFPPHKWLPVTKTMERWQTVFGCRWTFLINALSCVYLGMHSEQAYVRTYLHRYVLPESATFAPAGHAPRRSPARHVDEGCSSTDQRGMRRGVHPLASKMTDSGDEFLRTVGLPPIGAHLPTFSRMYVRSGRPVPDSTYVSNNFLRARGFCGHSALSKPTQHAHADNSARQSKGAP